MKFITDIYNQEQIKMPESHVNKPILSIKEDETLYIILVNGNMIAINGEYEDRLKYYPSSEEVKGKTLTGITKQEINHIYENTMYTEIYVVYKLTFQDDEEHEIIFNSTRDVGSPNVKIRFI